ncbi:hypothetical protein FHG87_007630 [Trinorchestia longiramus]|nr:hypothetical protein FHG87_007630 [Trinorchestia longiramus]
MAGREIMYSSDPTTKTLQQSSTSEVEESLTVNEGSFHGEIKTFKHRHVIRSPQIVITCPADSFRQTFVCSACTAGPACCADQSEENKEPFSVDQRMSLHDNGSDVASDSEGTRICSECGSTYSENSDWSSSCSENGQDPEPNTSPLKKFTSIDNLNEVNSESNTGSFSNPRSNSRNESQSSSSSTSENEDEDDEEIILVQIDRNLKNVVDNHIRSRKISLNLSDAESLEDSRFLSPVKEIPNSKESKILQRFLKQVETHPQEEDLDVILEIVGEEDEEPCNRSKVNIRECTEKFKDIYARKLKEIYHRKYRNSDFSSKTNGNFQNDVDLSNSEPDFIADKVVNRIVTPYSLSRVQSTPTESASKSDVNDYAISIKESTASVIDSQQSRENLKPLELMKPKPSLTSIEPNRTYSKIPNMELKSYRPKVDQELSGSKFVCKNQMMIDKLPEIRQFHPNNIDPKIPLEDRTYLKATSLINEIESCFKETAVLVEKSIGSNRAPTFVVRSDIETQKLHPNRCKQRDLYSPFQNGKENSRAEKQNYSSCQYDTSKNERVINDYQSIWNFGKSDLPSPVRCWESDSLQKGFFEGNKNEYHSVDGKHLQQQETMKSNIGDSVSVNKGYDSENLYANDESNSQPDFIAVDTGYSRLDNTEQIGGCTRKGNKFKHSNDEFNSQEEALKVDTDRIPRTLEESIDIFEMILGDRRSESRKSYDSGLSSSTLVLNSSKFLKENSIVSSERCSKYNSTNDLLCVSDDDYFDQTWTLGRNRNRFKSALHLGDIYKTRNKLSPPEGSSDIPSASKDGIKERSPETNIKEPDFQNSYKKFDSFDLFSDFDNHIEDNRTRRPGNLTAYRPEIVKYRNRLSKRESKSKYKTENMKLDSSLMNDDKTTKKLKRKLAPPLQNNQSLSQWRSEPDFGKLTFPSFGFQCSSSEEYYDKNYLTTSITTSLLKNSRFGEDATEQKKMNCEENGLHRKKTASSATENGSAGISSGTMGILNEQPLFAQVDELLKGLSESRVDSSSESDEGVVSDQSDVSEFNHSERIKCASVSEIIEAIDGSNGDKELEKNIEQIVHGINSIKEKHLGKKIEEELENYIRPKIELLRENINTNLRTSTSNSKSTKMRSLNSVNERKRSIERGAADLSEKIKKLAELPEIRDVITKMNHQSTKSLWKLQSRGPLPRYSRKEEYERQLAVRGIQRGSDHVDVTRTSTRSSSCFSFFEDPDSGDVSDLSDCHIGNSRSRKRELSPSDANALLDSQHNRNSFIMKMLHQNLRCYVITLAFLEKLLNGDVIHSEPSIGICSNFFDDFSSTKTEIKNSGFAALEKAMSMLPGISGYNATSCEQPIYDIGHQAFLQGLHRQHLVESQRNS